MFCISPKLWVTFQLGRALLWAAQWWGQLFRKTHKAVIHRSILLFHSNIVTKIQLLCPDCLQTASWLSPSGFPRRVFTCFHNTIFNIFLPNSACAPCFWLTDIFYFYVLVYMDCECRWHCNCCFFFFVIAFAKQEVVGPLKYL